MTFILKTLFPQIFALPNSTICTFSKFLFLSFIILTVVFFSIFFHILILNRAPENEISLCVHLLLNEFCRSLWLSENVSKCWCNYSEVPWKNSSERKSVKQSAMSYLFYSSWWTDEACSINLYFIARCLLRHVQTSFKHWLTLYVQCACLTKHYGNYSS